MLAIDEALVAFIVAVVAVVAVVTVVAVAAVFAVAIVVVVVVGSTLSVAIEGVVTIVEDVIGKFDNKVEM